MKRSFKKPLHGVTFLAVAVFLFAASATYVLLPQVADVGGGGAPLTADIVKYFDGKGVNIAVANLDQARTVSAFVAVDDAPTSSPRGIVMAGVEGGWGLYLGVSGRVCFGKIGVNEVCSIRSIGPRVMHHVAAVYDGTKVSLYVDGSLDSEKPYVDTFDSRGEKYYIGGVRYAKWNSSNFFAGTLNGIRAYTVALNSERIGALARMQDGGAQDALLGSWLDIFPTPVCGDGLCQNISCTGSTCPAQETPENCPQDCKKTDPLVGDVNGDGTFGAADAILVQRHIAGSSRITDPVVFKRADADASGVIDNADVLLIQARGLGKVEFLPARFGDLNHNLRLDEEDPLIAQRLILADSIPVTDMYLADVNMDGKVNSIDADFITRAAAGLVTLPVTASSSQSSVSPRPQCGDGICQNAPCVSAPCPTQETPGICPQDCSCPVMMCPPTEPGCRYESTGKDANGCENACGKLVCDPKPVAYCGDGVVQDREQCDDKNRRPGDGCNSQCMKEFCGDRIVTPSQQEQCDDGNAVSGDGCSAACAFEYCGDGVVQALREESCDDGNLVSGDGCDVNCRLEMQTVPPAEKAPLQVGDVNGDGTFGAADAILVQRHIAGSSRITDPAVFKRADADASGVIDNADVLLIQARGLGSVASLPAKFGDVNHDLQYSAADTILVQRHVLGVSKLSSADQYLADVNMDGKVDATDVLLIQRAGLGLEKLPVTTAAAAASVPAVASPPLPPAAPASAPTSKNCGGKSTWAEILQCLMGK